MLPYKNSYLIQTQLWLLTFNYGGKVWITHHYLRKQAFVFSHNQTNSLLFHVMHIRPSAACVLLSPVCVWVCVQCYITYFLLSGSHLSFPLHLTPGDARKLPRHRPRAADGDGVSLCTIYRWDDLDGRDALVPRVLGHDLYLGPPGARAHLCISGARGWCGVWVWIYRSLRQRDPESVHVNEFKKSVKWSPGWLTSDMTALLGFSFGSVGAIKAVDESLELSFSS